MERRTFLAGAATAGIGLATGAGLVARGPQRPATSLPRTPTPQTRGDNPGAIAAAKGLCFGSCISINPLRSDPAYARINAENCNTAVHASALQWHELQGRRDAPYDFGNAERIYAWGKRNDIPFRGHLMLDWAGLPLWLEPLVAGMTPAQAEKYMRSHILRIGAHFRGRMMQWNVANEPMHGRDLRQYAWSKKLGENYLDIAFDAAAQADPGVPLAINQNLIEMDSSYQKRMRNGLLELVRRMKDRGVAIRSVGIEGHLQSDLRLDQYGLDEFIRALAGMDVSFMVTELDVDDRAWKTELRQRDASVAALVRDFLDVTLSQPRCEGLFYWGFFDKYSWLNKPDRARRDGMPQRATAFDPAGRPTSVWKVTIDALKRAPGPGKHALFRKN